MATQQSQEPASKAGETQPATQQANNQSETTQTVTTQNTGKPAKSGGTARSEILAPQQHVLDFLRNCEDYEAEALRVVDIIATSEGNLSKVDASKLRLLNNYLNAGLEGVDGNDRDKVQDLRLERAVKLMNLAAAFVVKAVSMQTSAAVMGFAAKASEVSNACKSLLNRANKQ